MTETLGPGFVRTEGRLGLRTCRILLVEDDDGDAGLVLWALNRQSEFAYTVDRARTVDECLDACTRRDYDVILLDMNLPGSEHFDTVVAVTQAVTEPALIVISGVDDQALALQAVQAGAQDYLVKQNVNQHEICRAIHYALERKQMGDYLLQLREEFLGHVSHEIRTPLTAAMGAVELLQDADFAGLTPAGLRLMSMVSSNLLLLRSMVGDLIDTTMVRSGKLTLSLRPVAVETLVQPVVHAMRSLAERAEVTLEGLTDPGLEVVADPERITQVLTNLVSNAIKYTLPAGRVSVRAEPGDAGQVRVTVEDTGRGIPQEALPFLFDRLYQVPKDTIATSRRGLGLGLFISREIVVAHGGQLGVASRLGAGTTMTFSLPTPD